MSYISRTFSTHSWLGSVTVGWHTQNSSVIVVSSVDGTVINSATAVSQSTPLLNVRFPWSSWCAESGRLSFELLDFCTICILRQFRERGYWVLIMACGSLVIPSLLLVVWYDVKMRNQINTKVTLSKLWGE